jgi:hypothetical protein
MAITSGAFVGIGSNFEDNLRRGFNQNKSGLGGEGSPESSQTVKLQIFDNVAPMVKEEEIAKSRMGKVLNYFKMFFEASLGFKSEEEEEEVKTAVFTDSAEFQVENGEPCEAMEHSRWEEEKLKSFLTFW